MMDYRVLSLPGRGSPNPYVDLLYDALLIHGIHLVGKLEFDSDWLKNNIDRFDAIHLHWPEIHWRGYKTPFLKKMRNSGICCSYRLAKFLEDEFCHYFYRKKIKWFENNICYLKEQGKHVLWTWHNIEPHETVDHLDFLGIQTLTEYADLIIFHSEWAAAQCKQKYNIRAKTVIMPHGNYDGIFPVPRNRNLVARELELDPDKPIVGCLGSIREYKGLDIASKALVLLDGASQFLCAGKPIDTFDLNKIKNTISKIKQSVIIPRRISDQEFSDYANLCDFLLLPYKQVTGSGALLAALTLGKGVIASNLPFFREILSEEPNAGLLVPPNDPEALAVAIRSYLMVPSHIRKVAARNLADKYRWSLVVKPVSETIQSLKND